MALQPPPRKPLARNLKNLAQRNSIYPYLGQPQNFSSLGLEARTSRRSAFLLFLLFPPRQGGWVLISRKYTAASRKRQGFVRRHRKKMTEYLAIPVASRLE
jgi:hypothetical protein